MATNEKVAEKVAAPVKSAVPAADDSDPCPEL